MRGRVGAIALAAVLLLAAGCGSEGPGDTSDFSSQRQALENAWRQGWEARASLDTYGHTPGKDITAQMCGTYFDGTDAQDVGRSDKFRALARIYFIKGCLGQPTPPPTTTGEN